MCRLLRLIRLATFQCSSASRKFLNYADKAFVAVRNNSFSALQRAENSSTGSAVVDGIPIVRFSALQRAENSSTDPT